MQSNDPFAPPSKVSSQGMPHPHGLDAYPAGYYQPIASFDLNRMIAAPFKSPNWLSNVLWVLVCDLLSIVFVGNILRFGYLAEVAEARSGGRSEHWPDFTWERFNEYLLRGLWPFLWSLLWMLPLLVLLAVPLGTTIGLSSFLMNNNNEVPGFLVLITGMLVTIVVHSCALVAMSASMMHAALGNDFMKGADIGWIQSYVSKMWRTTIWVGLVFVLVGIAVNIAGLLLFCIGSLVASPIMSMMAADVVSQLHDIFVSRGGESAYPPRPDVDPSIIEAQVIL